LYLAWISDEHCVVYDTLTDRLSSLTDLQTVWNLHNVHQRAVQAAPLSTVFWHQT